VYEAAALICHRSPIESRQTRAAADKIIEITLARRRRSGRGPCWGYRGVRGNARGWNCEIQRGSWGGESVQ